MREMIPTSAQWYSWAARDCPTPQHYDRHGIINFSEISAIFAEIDPIEQTMNSYKNHEFIPPGGVTKRGWLYSLHFNSYNPSFWMVFIYVDPYFSLLPSTYFCEFLPTTAQGANRSQKTLSLNHDLTRWKINKANSSLNPTSLCNFVTILQLISS